MRVAALNLYVRIYPRTGSVSPSVHFSVRQSVCPCVCRAITQIPVLPGGKRRKWRPMSLPRSQSQSQSIDEFRVGDLWGRVTGQPFSTVAITSTSTLSPVGRSVGLYTHHIYYISYIEAVNNRYLSVKESSVLWVCLSLCHQIIISDCLVVNVCHFTYGLCLALSPSHSLLPSPSPSCKGYNYGVFGGGYNWFRANRNRKNRKCNYLFIC